MFRYSLLALILHVIVSGIRAEEEAPKASTEPRDLPIELKIVADAATWELNSRGDPPFKFQENIRKGEKSGQLVSATSVELELEIKNKSNHSIRIWVDGDDTLLTFDLKGPGAMTAQARPSALGRAISPRSVTIQPGRSYRIPLTSLSDGLRLTSRHLYITEIGDYRLSATFKTGVSPAPLATRELSGGFGEVILKSAPIKFHVKRPS